MTRRAPWYLVLTIAAAALVVVAVTVNAQPALVDGAYPAPVEVTAYPAPGDTPTAAPYHPAVDYSIGMAGTGGTVPQAGPTDAPRQAHEVTATPDRSSRIMGWRVLR